MPTTHVLLSRPRTRFQPPGLVAMRAVPDDAPPPLTDSDRIHLRWSTAPLLPPLDPRAPLAGVLDRHFGVRCADTTHSPRCRHCGNREHDLLRLRGGRTAALSADAGEGRLTVVAAVPGEAAVGVAALPASAGRDALRGPDHTLARHDPVRLSGRTLPDIWTATWLLTARQALHRATGHRRPAEIDAVTLPDRPASGRWTPLRLADATTCWLTGALLPAHTTAAVALLEPAH
ncbi:hypothetical protein [Streptomyces sp. NPDC049040]|uniref:hypothetical protein n=1 Tax=Streptomyces sp. NPDC049040 TaxID=3365593 RepID=UPI0037131F76